MGRRRSEGAAGSVGLRRRLAEVQSCEDSGESLKAYAERRGISVHSLYQAKKLARRLGLLPPHRTGKAKASREQAVRPPRFVEATAVVSSLSSPAAWRLRFTGGEVLESHTPLDVEVAVRLIESLGRRS
jgi:hypothetical protein